MSRLILNFIGLICLTASYTQPDCHALLLSSHNEGIVRPLASSIDKCFWDRFQISDPFDLSWFRCTTRRPSGVTRFTPNSLEAVLSRAFDDARHIQLAKTVSTNVCDGEDDFLPFDLLRFHVANVLKVNMMMIGNVTPNPYTEWYDSTLSDVSGGHDDGLWHLLNIVGSFHLRNHSKITQTWISAALDAWLIKRIDPRTSTDIHETFQAYWHCILKHLNSPHVMHIDEDVGTPLLELLGDIYASSLRFDVDLLLKRLKGMRGRIDHVDQLLSQN